jgi:hypothetical protein
MRIAAADAQHTGVVLEDWVTTAVAERMAMVAWLLGGVCASPPPCIGRTPNRVLFAPEANGLTGKIPEITPVVIRAQLACGGGGHSGKVMSA